MLTPKKITAVMRLLICTLFLVGICYVELYGTLTIGAHLLIVVLLTNVVLVGCWALADMREEDKRC